MATTALPPGVSVRRWERRDGTITESYTVRWKDPDGTKRRRSFDTIDDALDFQAKRRSARRWRPEELRQEQAGRLTLGEFFEQWWRDHATDRPPGCRAGPSDDAGVTPARGRCARGAGRP